MGHLHIFKKILLIFSIVFAGVFALSGTYLLVTYLSNSKTNALNKINISEKNQTSEFVFANGAMFPGDTKTYTLEIKSDLVENVNYEISFIDHQVSEDDKMFYVSVYNDNQDLIINNTLDQIFNKNLVVSRKLQSYESENLYFEFHLSALITKENYDFNFTLLFKADGRLVN